MDFFGGGNRTGRDKPAAAQPKSSSALKLPKPSKSKTPPKERGTQDPASDRSFFDGPETVKVEAAGATPPSPRSLLAVDRPVDNSHATAPLGQPSDNGPDGSGSVTAAEGQEGQEEAKAEAGAAAPAKEASRPDFFSAQSGSDLPPQADTEHVAEEPTLSRPEAAGKPVGIGLRLPKAAKSKTPPKERGTPDLVPDRSFFGGSAVHKHGTETVKVEAAGATPPSPRSPLAVDRPVDNSHTTAPLGQPSDNGPDGSGLVTAADGQEGQGEAKPEAGAAAPAKEASRPDFFSAQSGSNLAPRADTEHVAEEPTLSRPEAAGKPAGISLRLPKAAKSKAPPKQRGTPDLVPDRSFFGGSAVHKHGTETVKVEAAGATPPSPRSPLAVDRPVDNSHAAAPLGQPSDNGPDGSGSVTAADGQEAQEAGAAAPAKEASRPDFFSAQSGSNLAPRADTEHVAEEPTLSRPEAAGKPAGIGLRLPKAAKSKTPPKERGTPDLTPDRSFFGGSAVHKHGPETVKVEAAGATPPSPRSLLAVDRPVDNSHATAPLGQPSDNGPDGSGSVTAAEGQEGQEEAKAEAGAAAPAKEASRPDFFSAQSGSDLPPQADTEHVAEEPTLSRPEAAGKPAGIGLRLPKAAKSKTPPKERGTPDLVPDRSFFGGSAVHKHGTETVKVEAAGATPPSPRSPLAVDRPVDNSHTTAPLGQASDNGPDGSGSVTAADGQEGQGEAKPEAGAAAPAKEEEPTLSRPEAAGKPVGIGLRLPKAAKSKTPPKERGTPDLVPDRSFFGGSAVHKHGPETVKVEAAGATPPSPRSPLAVDRPVDNSHTTAPLGQPSDNGPDGSGLVTAADGQEGQGEAKPEAGAAAPAKEASRPIFFSAQSGSRADTEHVAEEPTLSRPEAAGKPAGISLRLPKAAKSKTPPKERGTPDLAPDRSFFGGSAVQKHGPETVKVEAAGATPTSPRSPLAVDRPVDNSLAAAALGQPSDNGPDGSGSVTAADGQEAQGEAKPEAGAAAPAKEASRPDFFSAQSGSRADTEHVAEEPTLSRPEAAGKPAGISLRLPKAAKSKTPPKERGTPDLAPDRSLFGGSAVQKHGPETIKVEAAGATPPSPRSLLAVDRPVDNSHATAPLGQPSDNGPDGSGSVTAAEGQEGQGEAKAEAGAAAPAKEASRPDFFSAQSGSNLAPRADTEHVAEEPTLSRPEATSTAGQQDSDFTSPAGNTEPVPTDRLEGLPDRPRVSSGPKANQPQVSAEAACLHLVRESHKYKLIASGVCKIILTRSLVWHVLEAPDTGPTNMFPAHG